MSDASADASPRAPELSLPQNDKLVAVWLVIVCALVSLMIVIGGATRLTDSGLSITEWHFGRQLVPPLTEAGWARAFALYQQTTEFKEQNFDMTPADFRTIFYWEWGHRFLGQLIGFVFAIPFLFFLATGRLKGRVGPVLLLGLLGGLQGAVGWWMVVSGLVGRVDVSPIRLATHLGVAFIILGWGAWLTLKELGWPKEASSGGPGPAWIGLLLAALFMQILLGALTAGSDAGRAFPDWPTIGGEWIPIYVEPFASNFTQNLATIQFHHRTMGYLLFVGLLVAAYLTRRRALGPVRTLSVMAAHVASLQVVLGIGAVVMGAPLWISLIHQGVAILLWLSLVAWLAAARNGTQIPHEETQGAQGPLQS